MLHNYQYKFLSISRCRYLRLVVPLCSIFAFLMGNAILDTLFNSHNCYAAVTPTASLSVSNPTLSTTVAPGDTAYLSSNVTYSASDIDSYTLQVSYANGYNSLKLDGGSTMLSGANGTSGSSLANNSWGFAWTNNTTNNTSTNAGLTYYTVPTYGTSGSGLSTGRLENATLPESANNTLDSTTKRIVFAAKFAENNTNSGHYKTGVQLSMVATPRKLIGLEKANTMQDLATHPEYCEETPLLDGQKYSAEYKLMDNRAYPSGVSNQYTIRKFADGRCWMTENLRINNTTIKATDSDFTTTTVSSGEIALPSSGKGDFANNDASKYGYRSYLSTSSEAPAGVSGYYNWYTATAGAGNSSVTTQNQSVNTSICPKGWTLPTGGSVGDPSTESTWSDYYKLFRNMGLTISNSSLPYSHNGYARWGSGDLAIVQGDVYNFKYTGILYNNSLYSTGDGYWWSSTVSGTNRVYLLGINSSNVYPGTNGNLDLRSGGFPMRCIARDPDLSEITTMQEMTPRVCNKTAVGTSKTLTDTRDGNAYTIRKFSDNRCWMTDNLKLKLTTAGLKQSDTDLNQGADWNQSSALKPTNTLASLNTTSGSRNFSSDQGNYAVESYITSSSNAGETGYYSWAAATAGSGTSDLKSGNATSSICPKGWKLPSGGTTSSTEFYNLFNTIKNSSGASIYENDTLKTNDYTSWKEPKVDNLKIVQDAPYNFKSTGRIYNGSLNAPNLGPWWSDTPYYADRAYHLYIGGDYAAPGTISEYRYFGFAVRCIARDS